MSQFEIGEVAIVKANASEFAGAEVTILHAKRVAFCFTGGRHTYLTSACPNTWFCDCSLRKHRPPQDWAALCNLTAVVVVRAKELV